MLRSILRPAVALAATLACALAATPPAAADDCLYAIDLGPNGSHVTTLYDVDPSTGALSNPRSTGIGNAIGLALGPDGYLYAVTTSPNPKLYKIHPTTGASTLIGSLGLSGSLLEGDLAFDPNGTLYGISNQIKFFTVDLNTGAATLLPSVGNYNADYSYLAFHSNGTLYALDNGASAGLFPNLWQTVDPSTGSILTSQSKSYSMGPAGGMDFDGISGKFLLIDSKFSGSTAPGSNSLYKVDLSGNRTLVGSLGQSGAFAGLASCTGDVVAPTSCIDPPSGMEGWYPFDESGGTGATDIAGLHLGLKVNGPAPASGKVAGAMELDGVDDYAWVPHTVDYNFDGPGGSGGTFTIDAWIHTSGDESGTIVAKVADGSSPTLYRGYSFGVSSGLLYFAMDTDAASPFTHIVFELDVIQPETWHHVAVTVDRNATPSIVLYVDGQPVKTGTSYPQTQTDNTEPLYVGGWIDPDTGQPVSLFDGRIDELEIFRRALEPDEIYLLWAAGAYGKCKDPCPAIDVLGDGPVSDPADPVPEPVEVLGILYRLRDERLAESPNGLYFTELFQRHRLRTSYLMLRSSELREAARQVLYDYAPGLERQLDGTGSEVHLSEEMVAEVIDFADLLIATDLDHGGGELAAAVDREVERIDWSALPGKSFDELWLYLDALPLE